MLEQHLERIFQALETSSVRYLVVGGLAVVAHGHTRFTADLDLVVALDAKNIDAAIKALAALGYVPRAPVPAENLAIPAIRQQWISEKGMQVFQLFSDAQPETAVDIFVQEPFDFDLEYRNAPRMPLVEGCTVPVVSFETLLRMKRSAGRRRDLDDIEQLELIRRSSPGQPSV